MVRSKRLGGSSAARFMPLVWLGAAAIFVVTVLPSVLRPPPDTANTSAEFSPDAPPEDDPDAIIQSLRQAGSQHRGRRRHAGGRHGRGPGDHGTAAARAAPIEGGLFRRPAPPDRLALRGAVCARVQGRQRGSHLHRRHRRGGPSRHHQLWRHAPGDLHGTRAHRATTRSRGFEGPHLASDAAVLQPELRAVRPPPPTGLGARRVGSDLGPGMRVHGLQGGDGPGGRRVPRVRRTQRAPGRPGRGHPPQARDGWHLRRPRRLLRATTTPTCTRG